MDEFDWDDLMGELTTQMNKINPDGYWKARVENFGWRSLSGQMDTFKATTGQELLGKILPKTDCSFRIKKMRNGFAINNAHHDSPVWAEWYYVTKAKPRYE